MSHKAIKFACSKCGYSCSLFIHYDKREDLHGYICPCCGEYFEGDKMAKIELKDSEKAIRNFMNIVINYFDSKSVPIENELERSIHPNLELAKDDYLKALKKEADI